MQTPPRCRITIATVFNLISSTPPPPNICPVPQDSHTTQYTKPDSNLIPILVVRRLLRRPQRQRHGRIAHKQQRHGPSNQNGTLRRLALECLAQPAHDEWLIDDGGEREQERSHLETIGRRPRGENRGTDELDGVDEDGELPAHLQAVGEGGEKDGGEDADAVGADGYVGDFGDGEPLGAVGVAQAVEEEVEVGVCLLCPAPGRVGEEDEGEGWAEHCFGSFAEEGNDGLWAEGLRALADGFEAEDGGGAFVFTEIACAGVGWIVGDGKVGDGSADYCHDAVDDEEPSPAWQSGSGVQSLVDS